MKRTIILACAAAFLAGPALAQSGLVGKAEELGQMLRRAGRFLTADHGEVALVTVEPGKEHDAGLVEAGRRLEDMA